MKLFRSSPDMGKSGSGQSSAPQWKHNDPRRDAGSNHLSILYLENVEVNFNGFKALDIADFFVNRGELRFLIGPNGAGKTTLLDVVCRKVKAKRGRVVFDGHSDLQSSQIQEVAKMGISRKFQAPSIFPNLSVKENMLLAYPRARTVLSGLFFKTGKEEESQIEEVLSIIKLTDKQHLPAFNLSHGQKQWLEIGLTLLQKPKLLMVDEPVAGMSESERQATGLLLQEVAKDCAVLVVEHDMHFVKQFSQTVSVLHEGRILCEGNFETVSKNQEVIDVYLGRGKSKEVQHA